MKNIIGAAVLSTMALAAPAAAEDRGFVRPNLLIRQIVDGMPRGEKQEVRVLTATFKPGDKTVIHTHRFPVTVYILEGAFTLQLEGRAPVTIRAGEAMVEPPKTKMTGFNRGAGPLKVLIVYVSDPETPFLDPIK